MARAGRVDQNSDDRGSVWAEPARLKEYGKRGQQERRRRNSLSLVGRVGRGTLWLCSYREGMGLTTWAHGLKPR